MASIFVILRKDFLDMLPGRNTDSHKQCAAALLNFFRNQRPGWLVINVQQFQDILFDQWGKNTICKALEMLCNEEYIEREHHRMNGRAWQYRVVRAIKQMPKVEDPDQATVEFEEESDAPDTRSVTPEEATSIYKDPYKDPAQDPSAAEKKTEETEKTEQPTAKISAEERAKAEQQLRELRINPQVVFGTVLKFWANFPAAVSAVKSKSSTGTCHNPTGLLLHILKSSVPPVPASNSLEKSEIPPCPEGVEQKMKLDSNIKNYFYSEYERQWMFVLSNGQIRPTEEVLNPATTTRSFRDLFASLKKGVKS